MSAMATAITTPESTWLCSGPFDRASSAASAAGDGQDREDDRSTRGRKGSIDLTSSRASISDGQSRTRRDRGQRLFVIDLLRKPLIQLSPSKGLLRALQF